MVLSSPRVDGSLDGQGQLRLQQAVLVGALLRPTYRSDIQSTSQISSTFRSACPCAWSSMHTKMTRKG